MAGASAVLALNTMRLNRFSIRESHRPIMQAQLEYGAKARSPLNLVVSNVGRSPAHNVKVTFRPDLPDVTASEDGQPSLVPYLRRRYQQTFPVWPPGIERRSTYWIVGEDETEDGRTTSADGLNREVDAEIRYRVGPRPWHRSIKERYPLRISEMEDEVFTETRTSTSTRRIG